MWVRFGLLLGRRRQLLSCVEENDEDVESGVDRFLV
jgi:hypothetical protein